MKSWHAKRTVQRSFHLSWLTGLLLLLGLATVINAAPPRSWGLDEEPADVRLGPLKDLNGYFPFLVPESQQAWQQRAEELRRQVLVSQGLWPMPTRTPLEPVVHSPIMQGDYTIEKVYFASMPGFFVTGNLYRPVGRSGKRPTILCPHGHWANGRFYDCGSKDVRKQIVQGAERFEDGGRSPMQSRCVQLARMGCIVFHYDMIGYADSQQISQQVAHGFREQRPAMNAVEHWGLFSPQAESHLQSVMGLQTYNSIRALDFVCGLNDVDTQRIGVTGASGGGTQTFLLAAIDPRVQVAFPAVMVSTAMQGGCTCENACCLRVGTSNVELAALFAPKPLGLTAADDWTVAMATRGYPELVQLYRLFGSPDNVHLTPLTHFGHNYNYVSRAAMYHWFNQHFQLGLEEPIVEEDYERLSATELTVWDKSHPTPSAGPELEQSVLHWWWQDSERQLAALLPKDRAGLERYRQIVKGGLSSVIGRSLPDGNDISADSMSESIVNGYRQLVGLATYRLPHRLAAAANPTGKMEDQREQVPFVVLKAKEDSNLYCLVVHPDGKAVLFDDQGEIPPPLVRLLNSGINVCGIDCLMQGEFLAGQPPVSQTRRVENGREAAAYTFGYNPSLFAHRVHDILTMICLLQNKPFSVKRLDLVGLEDAGPLAAVASAVAPESVDRLAVDNADFRFAAVDDLRALMFLPGGAKYHDLPGAMAISAPAPLWCHTVNRKPPQPITAAYEAANASKMIELFAGDDAKVLSAVATWLIDYALNQRA